MPSFRHNAIVQLLRGNPGLVPELLERALGVTVPPHTVVTIADTTLEQLSPTQVCADLVVELADPDDPPKLTLITEVQLTIDDDKLYSWPAYQTTHRLRRRCDVGVVVVTPFKNVAAWASQPIPLGLGNVFRVLVLGPEQLPPILDLAAVAANPSLAILTTMAHGNEPGGIDILMATLEAIPRVDRENQQVYVHLIEKALSEALRQALRERIAAMQQSPDIEIAEVFQPLVERGVTRGKAEMLLRILEIRGVLLAPEQRERVLHADESQLDGWADQAMLARTADDLFE